MRGSDSPYDAFAAVRTHFAVDAKGAPLMDRFVLDGAAIRRVVRRHRPDFVVPEIEAIRTQALLAIERAGTTVIPSALAAHLTMNRDAIRSLAAEELRLPTARYAYASSAEELERAILGSGPAPRGTRTRPA